MTELKSILDECLEAILAGRASLDECITRHPEHAQALRSLTREALDLRYKPATNPDQLARARMRARVGQHMRRHPRRRSSWLPGWLSRPALRRAAVVIVAAVLALGSATWAAQAAAPGSPLYPLKRASEAVWGQIAGGGPKYRLALAERRLDEWITVQADKDEAGVARQAYRRALDELTAATGGQLSPAMMTEVQDQRRRLEAAGLQEPRLESLLGGGPSATPAPTTPPAEATEIQTPIATDSELLPDEDPSLEELLPTPQATELLP